MNAVERLFAMAEGAYFFARAADDRNVCQCGRRAPGRSAEAVLGWTKCMVLSQAYVDLGGTENVHVYLNMAFNALGMIREAFESCVAGLRIDPTEPHLLTNRRLYAEFLGVGPGHDLPQLN